jgi:8-amino-7-oxononanoate synthase
MAHSSTARTPSFIRHGLNTLKQSGLSRSLRQLEGSPGPRAVVDGREVLVFCSNNYLGLATDPRLKRAAHDAVEKYGCGATGSRLISGNLPLYDELETELAAFKGAEAALVFSSGYHANIGAVTALVETGDAIFSDALNHASLIDGSRLSRADVVVYRHCELDDLEAGLRSRAAARRKLIVTESVFSMDGDLAPLREIAWLAEKYGAMLLVDEAHATGVFGPTGAGLVEALGLQNQVHVQMGTFSKALGSLGGYLAAGSELIDYFINRSRSFIFTTGLPPATLAASAEAIRIVRSEPGGRAALLRNVARLREELSDIGFDPGPSRSQILPVLIGNDRKVMAACRFLLRRGVFVQGIRPPTVPSGTARLRITPMASHESEDLATAVAAFRGLYALLQSPKRATERGLAAVDHQ